MRMANLMATFSTNWNGALRCRYKIPSLHSLVECYLEEDILRLADVIFISDRAAWDWNCSISYFHGLLLATKQTA